MTNNNKNMHTFNADPTQEVTHILPKPIVGPGFQPNAEIINSLFYNQKTYDFVKESVDRMLAKSGVEVVEQLPETYLAAPSDANKMALSEQIDLAKSSVKEIYDKANEMLPELKVELVDKLSIYADTLGISKEKVSETLAKRIESLNEVRIDDLLTQNRVYKFTEATAVFMSGEDIMLVDPNKIRSGAEREGWTPEIELKRDILHELMHAASYRSKLEGIDYVVGVGLSVTPAIGDESKFRSQTGSILLEEGAQEDIRWRHVDKSTPSYERPLMFWEAAIAIDPSLEKDRFNAKFFNVDRGVMIAKIENIFGPYAVEIIESEMSDYNRLRDYPDWKDKLVGMIDVYDANPETRTAKTEAARKKAREVLDATQLEIYTPRGLGFSDSDLRYAKEHDGFLHDGQDITKIKPLNHKPA